MRAVVFLLVATSLASEDGPWETIKGWFGKDTKTLKAAFTTRKEELTKALENYKLLVDNEQQDYDYGPLAYRFRHYIKDAAKWSTDCYNHARKYADSYYSVVTYGTNAKHKPLLIWTQKNRPLNDFLAKSPRSSLDALNKYNRLDRITNKTDPRVEIATTVAHYYFAVTDISVGYFHQIKSLADEYQNKFL